MYLSTLALSPTAAANRRIGLLIFKPEITPLPILHQLRDTTKDAIIKFLNEHAGE
jgi:hypothetical protein